MAHYEPPSLSNKLENQSLASFETSERRPSSIESKSPRMNLAASLEFGFDEAYPRDIYGTKSFTRGICSSARSSFPWQTVTAAAKSEELSKIVTFDSIEDGTSEFRLEATTADTFKTFFPSKRMLQIFHENTTVDAHKRMNLRVVTEGLPLDDGRKTLFQLFHVQIFDVKQRKFSLRRYCRDSEWEICHTKREPIESMDMSASLDMFRDFLDWLDSNSSQVNSINSNLLERPRKVENTMSTNQQTHHDSSSFEEENKGLSSKVTTMSSKRSTIRLEFSNHAEVYLTLLVEGSKRSYEFANMGCVYTWKNVRRKVGGNIEVLFQLVRKGNVDSIAHILPKSKNRTPARIVADFTVPLVPPHNMWISDMSIVDDPTNIAE